MPTLVDGLALLAAAILGYQVLSFAQLLYRTIIRPAKNPRKYGKWAVVTGATDGIGKAMAFELARRGCSVMLISRSADKLAAVKAELSEKYPNVEVACEAVEFSSLTETRRSQVAEVLDKLEVGVLVNNVGMSYPFCQWFHELSDSEVSNLLSINIDSTTWMTRAVLPGMLRRKSGAVVNLSSAAAQSPLPLLAQYSAAKGYIVNLTRSLAAEYAKDGISFQCQFPLWVATTMTFPNSKVPVDKRASLMVPSMKTYARVSVNALGHEVMSCPYLPHALYMWLAARIPDSLKTSLIFDMHKKVRFHQKNVALMEKKLKGA